MAELGDSSRLRLHPLRVAPFGDGSYSVIRRGGRREIATRELGVEALARLRAGDTIGEARRRLAERHGRSPEQVRLEPLLAALMNAGMVAAVDGARVEGPRVGVRDHLDFALRFDVAPRIARAARRLPLGLARPLLRQLFAHQLAAPCAGKVRRAGANFERVFPGAGPRQRRAFEREYFRHLVANVVDLQALRHRPFDQIDEWLESCVRLEGLDVLDRARRGGRGVLLAGFHFASNRLLPVALMRRGYSLLSMGAISIGWGSQATKDLVARWRSARPWYGALELVDNLDLGSVNRLVAELRRGGTVLTLPDVYSLSTYEDAAVAERAKFFGIVRSRFRPATTPVRFFGHRLDVSPWGGWLIAAARPAVLPVAMERGARGLVCRFGEPLDFDDAGADSRELAARATQALFRSLAQEVARHPAQWFGWHNLEKLNPRPVTAAEPAGAGEALAERPGAPQRPSWKGGE